MKLTYWVLPLISILMGFFSSAQAFELDDHKHLMLQAVKEINTCFPGTFRTVDQDILWASDMAEDINLVRKDLEYSHFYNPYKIIKMFRYESPVRVGRLEADMQTKVTSGNWRDLGNLSSLGYAVHHLQDMAAPPHVIPVMHGPSDGFERYQYNGDISSGLSCQEIATSTQDLNSLLVETSRQTMSNVNGIHVTGGMLNTLALTEENMEITLTGESFWQESAEPAFGRYGYVGNNYGRTEFVENGITYRVPDSFYSQFKQAQMKLAVKASVKGLYWYLKLKNEVSH